MASRRSGPPSRSKVLFTFIFHHTAIKFILQKPDGCQIAEDKLLKKHAEPQKTNTPWDWRVFFFPFFLNPADDAND